MNIYDKSTLYYLNPSVLNIVIYQKHYFSHSLILKIFYYINLMISIINYKSIIKNILNLCFRKFFKNAIINYISMEIEAL